jgi:hypothetical protein
VTYSWYQDSTCTTPITTGGALALSGTGNSTLTVNPALLANQGSYYATATETSQGNSSITATSACSSAATLAVTVGNWQPDAPTTTPRYEALSLMLPNGTFWVAGGQNDSGLLNNDSIYTPATAYTQPTGTSANNLPTNGTWAASTSNSGPTTFVAGPHLDGTATLLPDGEVMIAGGSSGTYAQYGIEIYNPFSQSYRASNVTLNQATTQHVAAFLPNQKVLLAGGTNGDGDTFYNNAYLYTPGPFTGTNDSLLASSGHLSVARAGSRAVTLPDGRILILGGQDATGIDNAVDIYDSGTSTSAYGTTGSTAANPYTAVTGGTGDYFANANCAYTAGPTTCLGTPRLYETATLLNDGRVLIAGGLDNQGNVLNSIEIWDPTANGGAGGFYGLGTYTGPIGSGGTLTLHAAGTLATPRLLHSAVLLANGKVLIFGGTDGTNGDAPLNSAEVIDPNWNPNATGAAMTPSTPASSLNSARLAASSTLLPDGTVLTAGGYGSTPTTPSLLSSENFYAREGYSTAPARAADLNLPTVVPGSATSYTTSVSPGNNEELNFYYWGAPDENITSGQGTSSISFTVDASSTTTPPYHIFVLVTDQYGLSYYKSGNLPTH